MPSLRSRANTIPQLIEQSLFYCFERPLNLSKKAEKLFTGEALSHLASVRLSLASICDWNQENIEAAVKDYVKTADIKLGTVAQPLRAAFTGTNISPGIFEVAAILGREEALGRIDDAVVRQ